MAEGTGFGHRFLAALGPSTPPPSLTYARSVRHSNPCLFLYIYFIFKFILGKRYLLAEGTGFEPVDGN
jgi:hypothetical protein